MNKRVLALALLALAVMSSGCGTLANRNRAILTAAVGRGVGDVAFLRCGDLVARDPAAAVTLTAALNKAQAAVDQGSPLAGIFDAVGKDLDATAKLALAVVVTALERQMALILTTAEGGISGCRMGVVAAASNSPPPH